MHSTSCIVHTTPIAVTSIGIIKCTSIAVGAYHSATLSGKGHYMLMALYVDGMATCAMYS